MKKILLLLLALGLMNSPVYSQVPDLFNYQSVIRDADGNPLQNEGVYLQVSILKGSEDGTPVYVENHSVNSNDFGVVNFQVGDGVTTDDMASINWAEGEFYLKIESASSQSGPFSILGVSRLVSVPYAKHAEKSTVSENLNTGQLSIQGDIDLTSEDALFEVKDKNGNVVFAVYEEGVRVYVPENTKGSRAGFAVGGRSASKGISGEIMVISPDSVRIYISDDDQTKGSRAGFAVGGRSASKGPLKEYFNIYSDTTANIINPSQPRILWYPNKEAFLAGKVLVESPDSIGRNSMATGFESKAVGNYSQAFGYLPVARGDYSTAIGSGALANGNSSFALGSGATALGINAFAFGSAGLDTMGNPVGQLTTATGDYSFSLGPGSQSEGHGSVSFGLNSTAYGNFSTALGSSSYALGGSTFAAGQGTYARSYKSTVLGSYNYINSDEDSISWVDNDPLLVVGNGKGFQYELNHGFKSNAKDFLFKPIIKPPLTIPLPILSVDRSNAFMLFKNGNAILGGGKIYVTDQDARMYIAKPSGALKFPNSTKGLVIKDGIYNNGNAIEVQPSDSTTPNFVVTDAGKVGIGTTPTSSPLAIRGLAGTTDGENLKVYNDQLYFASSSEKFKSNIETLDEEFSKILNARPVSFIDNVSGKRNIGFIAEEFDEIGLNNLVIYKDGEPLSLKYELVSLYNLEIIKEMKETINEQQAQIEVLKNEKEELAQLKQEIEYLKQIVAGMAANK